MNHDACRNEGSKKLSRGALQRFSMLFGLAVGLGLLLTKSMYNKQSTLQRTVITRLLAYIRFVFVIEQCADIILSTFTENIKALNASW